MVCFNEDMSKWILPRHISKYGVYTRNFIDMNLDCYIIPEAASCE
jgi:hypothetical protein